MHSHKLPNNLKILWEQGFFSRPQTFDSITQKLSKSGLNPNKTTLSMALARMHFITRKGRAGQYIYAQKYPSPQMITTSDVMPADLITALGRDFKTEIADLKHNFNTSGTCTAFLLRKILEKLLFLTFSKNGYEKELYDTNRKLHGLQTLLALAVSLKVNGKPFLMQKTADAIQSLKFLGDTAAHNPLTNVSVKTIQPMMPYIITAYSELATKL